MRVPARERAQGLVEFAVIFPIFAFFLFAIIDGGVAMSRFQTIGGAAREGARYGAVGADATAIATRTADNAHGLLAGAGDCSAPDGTTSVCVQWVPGPSREAAGDVGSSVMVKVQYQYKLITPLLGLFGLSGDWTIKGCAMQRVERAVPPGSAVATAAAGATKC
ncbi:MAG: TadE/TadG family type IV pilus assembly protein [Candidatus Limnocylindria bacterium]